MPPTFSHEKRLTVARVALHNRHRYRSTIRMYDEAVTLPFAPDGYAPLLPPLLSLQTDLDSLADAV